MRWALVLLFAALPLQWFLVPGLPLGPQRLHLVAILVFTAFVSSCASSPPEVA